MPEKGKSYQKIPASVGSLGVISPEVFYLELARFLLRRNMAPPQSSVIWLVHQTHELTAHTADEGIVPVGLKLNPVGEIWIPFL